MPYMVDSLLTDYQKPATVKRDDTVLHALNLMFENDYSQLPVVGDQEIPLGMITYESILRAHRNFHAPLEELTVGNAMIEVATFLLEDNLFDLLNRLRDTNAVLVKEVHSPSLVGIVTSYDSTEYFRKRSEDLMFLEDIEMILRELVRAYFSDDSDDVDEDALQQAINEVNITEEDLRKRFDAAVQFYLGRAHLGDQPVNSAVLDEAFRKLKISRDPKAFADLTLADLIELLLQESRWDFYFPILNLDRAYLRSLLDDVRKTRNAIAHFKGEQTNQQREQLKFCSDYLNRCHQEYAQAREKERIQRYLDMARGASKQDFALAYSATDDSTETGTSTYGPLAGYLQSLPGDVSKIQLTFAEIEEVIGASLPASAYKHTAWWANDSVAHAHSVLWLDAGWRVTYRNLTDQHVTFARIKERERAYINYFAGLLNRLKKETMLPIKNVSPDGVSWIELIRVPQIGKQKALFGCSFALGGRARVELYIDTGDEGQNKAAFDTLLAMKVEIEREVGSELSWERLDNRRACRISSYHSGKITDDSGALSELTDWMVTGVGRLYHALYDRACTASKSQASN